MPCDPPEPVKTQETQPKIVEGLVKNQLLTVGQPAFGGNIFKTLKVIGQYNNSFILCGSTVNDALYLLDQHSLEESIRFSYFVRHKRVVKQTLTFRQNFTDRLPLDRKCVLDQQERVTFGEEWGFKIQREGGQYYLLQTGIIDNKLLTVDDLVQMLNEDATVPEQIHKIWANRACKASVKLGDQLTMAQMCQLLAKAAECGTCFNCPHGRPTIQQLEIE